MDMFTYIVESNPDACYNFCQRYGYIYSDINSLDELSAAVQETVAAEGEPALKDLLKFHPDRNVIIETFGENKKQMPVGSFGYDGTVMPLVAPYKKEKDCSCEKKNATGDAAIANQSSNTTGIFIVAAALLLSVAIITRK